MPTTSYCGQFKVSWSRHDTLQQAIDTINTYLIPKGLRCQSEKSALLMLRLRTRERPAETPSNSTLAIKNTPIPQVSALCNLGVPLHRDGPSAALSLQLTKACSQLTCLTQRLRHQHAVLREDESCKQAQTGPAA